MFQNISRRQNDQQPDKNVQKEAQLEKKLIQPAGNEAMNVDLMEQMLQKQNNNNNSGNPPDKSGEKGKKPTKEDEKKALKLAEDIVKEQGPKDEKELPPISTYDYAPDEDMVAEADPEEFTRDKDYDSLVKKLPETSVENAEENKDARWKAEAARRIKKVELRNLAEQQAFQAEEMEKVRNWDFNSQKLDNVKKPGKGRSFLTWMASGIGKFFGALLNFFTPNSIMYAKNAVTSAAAEKKKWQDKKDYQNIPGWDGAKYDSNATGGEDVMADFRRVPTVWSHLTAAKAAEPVQKNGKEEEKPLDPVVSVLIEQPKSGSSDTMNGTDFGHAMIGIEYSRKSLVSNRYERYKLQYGFYPAGGTTSPSGVLMMGGRHNAVLPGQMKDDYDHTYDVSRRYPAKPEQVNAIFQASEKYAEGGYGYYDRNCTTFVKEMVVDTAHLATGGAIFKQAEIQNSDLANAGVFASEAFDPNIKSGVDNIMLNLGNKNDTTYQNYGNKRATRQDWNNYKNSMKNNSSPIKTGYIPAEVGEQLRRMEGDQAGELGSHKPDKLLMNEQKEVVVSLQKIENAIDKTGSNIQKKIGEIFTPEQQEQMPYELLTLSQSLSVMGTPLLTLDRQISKNLDKENKGKKDEEKLGQDEINEEYYITPDELREARAILSDNITKVNILLNNYLKNDKRLHQPLMSLISLLNYGIMYVDTLYQRSALGGLDEKDNPVNIREEMRINEYTIRAGGKEARFTPTHYESYIQIYKDPKIAVAKYAQLKDLQKKKVDGELSRTQKEELIKLERLESLAKEFDNSHNYMIEKDRYNQQDIDYAFRLRDKETNGLEQRSEVENEESYTNEDIQEKYRSASGIYIALIMDKIFGGMKKQWDKGTKDGGLDLDQADNQVNVQIWLNKFLKDRIKEHSNEFQAIVRGLYRSMQARQSDKQFKDQDLLTELSTAIKETVINRHFKGKGRDNKEIYGANYLGMSIDEIVQNKSMDFTKLVTAMIKVCRMEDADKTLTVKNIS